MYTVTVKDLFRIKEFSILAFEKLHSAFGMDQVELQQFLIIQGIHDFLKSKGVEPGFSVEDLNCKHENDNFEIAED